MRSRGLLPASPPAIPEVDAHSRDSGSYHVLTGLASSFVFGVANNNTKSHVWQKCTNSPPGARFAFVRVEESQVGNRYTEPIYVLWVEKTMCRLRSNTRREGPEGKTCSTEPGVKATRDA